MPNLDDAYRILGVPPDTSFVDAYQVYAETRRALLSDGKLSPMDSEVVEIDDAFALIRAQDPARRERSSTMGGGGKAAEARAATQPASDQARSDDRAAQRRESRLRKEAMQMEYARQGWPPRWPPSVVERLRSRGVPPASALDFSQAGWTHRETDEALRRVDQSQLSDLQLPEGSAQHHRTQGDTLAELLAEAWPPTPAATILSLKRITAKGRRIRYVISASDSGDYVLARHQRNVAGWKTTEVGRSAELDDLVARSFPLRRTKTDEVLSYQVAKERLDQIVPMLRVVDSGYSPEPADSAESDRQFWWVADFVDVEGGHLLEPRCKVNGLPLVGFRFDVGANSSPAALYDEDEERFWPATSIARSTWFSEAGGAPTSWNGGNSLEQLPGGVVLTTQWGDTGYEARAVKVGRRESALTSFVARWVGEIEASISAALDLEPLQLPKTATPAEAGAWNERLGISMTFTLELPQPQVDAIRRRLRRTDPLYRATADALAHPRSASGRRLAAALDEVLSDGVLGHLRAADLT